MKNTLLVVTTLLFSFYHAIADDYPIASKSVAIKVYPSGAELKHQASASLTNGTHRVIFKNLPPEIFDGSVRLSGSGPAMTILSVEYRKDFINDVEKLPRFKSLQDSIENLQSVLTDLGNKVEVLEQEKQLFQANKVVSGAQSGLNTAELIKMADLFRSRLADVYEKIASVNKRQNKLNKELQRLQQELGQLGQQGTYISQVVADVEVKSSGTAQFILSYFTQLVNWTPLYDLQVDSKNNKIEIKTKARISQNTGFDFKDLKLSISTGSPSFNISKPVIDPWYLDIYYPRPTTQRYRSNAGGQAPQAAPATKAMAEETAMIADDMSQFSSVSDNAMSMEYALGLELDLKHGENKVVALQNTPLDAQFTYAAVPRLSKEVKMLAKTTGFQDLGFLNGSANIYFDDAFVGTTNILDNVTNDTLVLPLGTDPKVTVEFKQVKAFTADKKLTGKRVKSYTNVIVLKNNRKEAIEIEIEDQIPVSRNKEIEVETEDLDGGELTEETGIIKWKFNVSTGGSKKLTSKFLIRFPKDKMIQGL